jgi:hypothetical protein
MLIAGRPGHRELQWLLAGAVSPSQAPRQCRLSLLARVLQSRPGRMTRMALFAAISRTSWLTPKASRPGIHQAASEPTVQVRAYSGYRQSL